MWGPAGREGMGLVGGDGALDGRTSKSGYPPGRTPALTPVHFAGLSASSDHQVADLGSWTPAPFKISRATAWIGTVSAPAWPQHSLQSYLGRTWSPRPQESQALKHGHLELSRCRPGWTAPGWRIGMQRKGRRDRETPQITAPQEDIPPSYCPTGGANIS